MSAALGALVASRSLRTSAALLSGLTCVLAVGFFASVRGGFAAPPGLLDPAQGQIDGKIAMAVVPAKSGGGNGESKLEPLPPWGFEAHLTGYDDPAVELVFPCGIWFQPPPGRYRVWITGEWQISPFSLIVKHSSHPFRDHGQLSAIPVIEGGRVILSAEDRKQKNAVLRLLHAGDHLEAGYPRWELSRRKAAPEVGEGLLMPVGLAIGALWDEGSQSYTAISRPFEVKARQAVTVPLERPTNAAHLVVQIQRPGLARDAADGVKAVLHRNGQDLPPEIQVAMADRAYAIWYGLPPGPVELRVGTEDSSSEKQQIVLSAGKIGRVLAKLKPLPSWAGGSKKQG